MFGNKSAGIVDQIARGLSSRKARRAHATFRPPISDAKLERMIRDRKERYLVQMQYLWSKQ